MDFTSAVTLRILMGKYPNTNPETVWREFNMWWEEKPEISFDDWMREKGQSVAHIINWDQPIQIVDKNLRYDIGVEVDTWEDGDERGFAEILMYYPSISPNTSVNGLFWDTYCVDCLTGKPLNPFMPKEFAVENIKDE